MILNGIARLFYPLYFFFVSACLRLMAAPLTIQIYRQQNAFSRLFICFGHLTPLQRKVLEIRFNRYRSLFWGGWSLVFASDLPLLQQTINLSWFRFEARFLKLPGFEPSRTDQNKIEAALFLLKKLKQDFSLVQNPNHRTRKQWKKYFTAAGIEYDRNQSIAGTVYDFLSSLMGLDASEKIGFIETQQEVLQGAWINAEPWKLAPILKAKPEIWCWWFAQFPFDWAEVPRWTELQKKILFASARWEISRGLLQDWKLMGFADEFKRLELFFAKSFHSEKDSELQLTLTQLQEARAILTAKDQSVVPT